MVTEWITRTQTASSKITTESNRMSKAMICTVAITLWKAQIYLLWLILWGSWGIEIYAEQRKDLYFFRSIFLSSFLSFFLSFYLSLYLSFFFFLSFFFPFFLSLFLMLLRHWILLNWRNDHLSSLFLSAESFIITGINYSDTSLKGTNFYNRWTLECVWNLLREIKINGFVFSLESYSI
jgi:hypothetical protein